MNKQIVSLVVLGVVIFIVWKSGLWNKLTSGLRVGIATGPVSGGVQGDAPTQGTAPVPGQASTGVNPAGKAGQAVRTSALPAPPVSTGLGGYVGANEGDAWGSAGVLMDAPGKYDGGYSTETKVMQDQNGNASVSDTATPSMGGDVGNFGSFFGANAELLSDN